jgi:hypothetical protein
MQQRLPQTARARALCAVAAALAGTLLAAAPAMAQPGWGPPSMGSDWYGRSRVETTADPREGKVDAERFVGEGAESLLGHGRVAVKTLPGTTSDEREAVTFEAAMVDQLARAGYDTLNPLRDDGQVLEITVRRDVLVPAEDKKNPVSGSAMMGVSNRGSMMAVSLAYDATKPRAALIETAIELRLRDKATGRALYEARARIATREGDKRWSDSAVASRLAAAAFEHFPGSVAPAPRK